MIDGGNVRMATRRGSDALGILARGAAAACVVLWVLSALAGGLWLVQRAVTMPVLRTELVLRVEQGRPWTTVDIDGEDVGGLLAAIREAKAAKIARR